MRRQAGFTMVGVLIGLALAVVTMFGWMQYSGKLQRLALQDSGIKQQAQEMKIMTDAVRAYVDANKASWTNGSRQVITVAQLITAGYLPANFAVRHNVATPGTTPLGQRYRAISIKAANDVPPVAPGTVRSIVLQENSAVLGALDRLYIANTAAEILGFQRKVALIGNRDHRLVTGAIAQGTSAGLGVGGAFTKDLTAWLTTPATAAFSVSFLGFPDLGGDDGGGGPEGYPVGDCVVSAARAFVGNPTLLVEQACPADYPINAGSWPHCKYPGGPVSVTLPLIGTAVTLSEQTETRFDLPYSSCMSYAFSAAGCSPGQNVLDPCAVTITSIAQGCSQTQSSYTSTLVSLNAGYISGPNLCYADRAFINSQPSIVFVPFSYTNPETRDNYCCKPPPQ